MRDKKQDECRVRGGQRPVRPERSSVLAAAISGAVTALASGLVGFLVEAVRGVLG
ncbi:hypothetical protein ACIQHY_11340 [Streptomyces sp. NPDC092359]|uniref:hypothetical protein n=1 Tax=Streptomyces sp. NPDC092359 TaxID=3366014 RepID=UPI0037F28937